MFVLLSSTNSNPSGISSFILSAYPATVPSLYTLIVYSTKSPFVVITGSFVWLYVISPVSSFTITCGTLASVVSPFTPVMNFLNDKSKYLTTTYSLSISSSPSSPFPGTESTSGVSYSLLSSFISAVFINVLSDVFGSITLNTTFTSLYTGSCMLSLSNADIILFTSLSFDR